LFFNIHHTPCKRSGNDRMVISLLFCSSKYLQNKNNMTEKIYQQRDYQLEAIETCFNELRDGIQKQMIVMATGLGKTFVSREIASRFNRILFIAHREELIDQAYAVFDEQYPLQVGIIKERIFEVQKKIVIASVQTLTNRLHLIDPKEFELVIIDEVHHYAAASYIKVAHFFEPQLLLGLTATPHRLDGLNLSNIVDKIVYDYGIDKGVKNGWLCELDAYRIRTDTDLTKVKRTGGDFQKKELSVAVDSPERNELIVRKYQQYASERQALVFAVDMNHAEHLCQAFKAQGISSDFVVSDEEMTPDRKQSVADFKAGKIQVMVNCMILTEGFDHCDIGAILMARPTQSLTVYLQCIGRGTRLKSQEFIFTHGKNNCIILDFVDNTGKHKLVNTWELDSGKRLEDQIFMSKERRDNAIEKREQQRMLKIKEGKDKKIDLLKLPIIKMKTDRGGFLEAASEKQLAWLKSEGVWEEGKEYTKGQAAEYITNFGAKDWQISKLKAWGYDCSNNPTQGQYYEILKEKQNSQPSTQFGTPKHVPFLK